LAARRQDLVLVVDDDSDFRALVRTLLERAAFRVEEAADGEETLAAVEREQPGLVLLDVCLPEMSGYEVHRELLERCGSTVPVIFVSGERTEALDRSAGLLFGADDYVVKPFDPGELIARVRRSLRRSSVVDAAEPLAGPGLDDLTPREREVLALLAAGSSTKQIVQELGITRRTLGSHVQHILSKLGVSSRTQAVALALRAGIRRDTE
jgi:two-component system nitrate/nitrite response regulator NarL